jgi:hypothetical protein
VQGYFKDISGLVLENHSRANVPIKQVMLFFWFQAHIEFMLIPHCSLLRVKKHYVLINSAHTLIKVLYPLKRLGVS